MWDPTMTHLGRSIVGLQTVLYAQAEALGHDQTGQEPRAEHARKPNRLLVTLSEFLVASGLWLKARAQASAQQS